MCGTTMSTFYIQSMVLMSHLKNFALEAITMLQCEVATHEKWATVWIRKESSTGDMTADQLDHSLHFCFPIFPVCLYFSCLIKAKCQKKPERKTPTFTLPLISLPCRVASSSGHASQSFTYIICQRQSGSRVLLDNFANILPGIY